jgi:hypothetical protein
MEAYCSGHRFGRQDAEIQYVNGWPGKKSHPFQGMKRKRFCPKPPPFVMGQLTQKGFKIIAI